MDKRSIEEIEIYNGSMPELLRMMHSELSHPGFKLLCTINPLIWQRFKYRSDEYFDRVQTFVCDGIGFARAYPRPIRRITGVDLVSAILSESSMRIAAIGASDEVIKTWTEQNRSRYGADRIVYTHHGYIGERDSPAIIDALQQSRPDIILVGMGAPKQEDLLIRLTNALDYGWGIGVGGSFDVLSGSLNRAPVWTQKLGVEWAYRLIQSPKRLTTLPKLLSFYWEYIVKLGNK